MSFIFEKIEKYGIKTIKPEEGGSLKINCGGETLCFNAPADTPVVWLETQYQNNCGLMFMRSGSFTALLLKGVYKDFIRLLTGDPVIEPTAVVKLAESAVNIERNFRIPLKLGFIFTDKDNRRLFYAVELTPPVTGRPDKRALYNYSMLSAVEYSLFKDDLLSGKTLYVKGMTAGIFPDTFSPFAASLARRVPDIFNPLLMSANIKSHSPSLKLVCSKGYINFSNVNSVCATIGTSADFAFLNYAPWILLKKDNPRFEVPKLSIFKINDNEISEAIEELSEFKNTLDKHLMFSGGFDEAPALAAMAAQMIQLMLWQTAAKLYSVLGSFEEVLKFAFLTREKTILEALPPMPPYLDPAYPMFNRKIEKPFTRKTFEELFATLPFRKRLTLSKSKLQETVSKLHKYLDMRDSLIKTTFAISAELRETMLSFGQEMVDGKLLTTSEDVFWFDLEDLVSFYKNDYFGNIPITLWFKKWQNERSSAQIVPYDIYEKDIGDIADISQRFFAKHLGNPSACVSYFAGNMEGSARRLSSYDDQPDDIALVQNLSPVMLSCLDKSRAVVAETAPLFSYIMEYCVLTTTPLYSGVRFAPLLYDGMSLKLTPKYVTPVE
jgi:hypothetical protein